MSLPHPAHYQTLEFAHVNALMADWRKVQQGRLRVLDFGCGKGKFLYHFAALGDEVVGVDTNPAYVQEALAKGIETHASAAFFTTALAPFDVIFPQPSGRAPDPRAVGQPDSAPVCFAGTYRSLDYHQPDLWRTLLS